MPVSKRIVTCVCGCGVEGRHRGRGLITACYWRLKRSGALDDFDTTQGAMSSEERYALLLRYRTVGMSDRAAARSMGITANGLQKMLRERKKKGLPIDDLRPGHPKES